jgi:hypothetical protein
MIKIRKTNFKQLYKESLLPTDKIFIFQNGDIMLTSNFYGKQIFDNDLSKMAIPNCTIIFDAKNITNKIINMLDKDLTVSVIQNGEDSIISLNDIVNFNCRVIENPTKSIIDYQNNCKFDKKCESFEIDVAYYIRKSDVKLDFIYAYYNISSKGLIFNDTQGLTLTYKINNNTIRSDVGYDFNLKYFIGADKLYFDVECGIIYGITTDCKIWSMFNLEV